MFVTSENFRNDSAFIYNYLSLCKLLLFGKGELYSLLAFETHLAIHSHFHSLLIWENIT